MSANISLRTWFVHLVYKICSSFIPPPPPRNNYVTMKSHLWSPPPLQHVFLEVQA